MHGTQARIGILPDWKTCQQPLSDGFWSAGGLTGSQMYNFRFQFCTLRFAVLLLAVLVLPVSAASLETVPVKLVTSGSIYTAEGVVESVKTTQIAAEMQGSITALTVKAGDVVKAGQVLARIDTVSYTHLTLPTNREV